MDEMGTPGALTPAEGHGAIMGIAATRQQPLAPAERATAQSQGTAGSGLSRGFSWTKCSRGLPQVSAWMCRLATVSRDWRAAVTTQFIFTLVRSRSHK
jgi:hypothetical protein